MKWIVVLLVAVSAAGIFATSPRPEEIFGRFRKPPTPVASERANGRLLLDKRITQKVDHFDEANTDTWEMRYFSNSQFYVHGGPLFIFVGGEWEIDFGFLTGGHMFDMAREMNGILFYTEHRYYGKSWPTSDVSTENLKYLDVNQALADLAHFIDVQRETLSGAQNAGVILVGGSYSASMVTWFKQAYPDKVNGVWASSAPLYAKADFSEYKEVVSDVIKVVGPEGCAERIEKAIGELEKDVAAGDTSRITTGFETCTEFTAEDVLEVQSFFSAISNRFSCLVQRFTGSEITDMCEIILDESEPDDVAALIKYIRSTRRNPEACYDSGYQRTVDYMRNQLWTDDAVVEADRQWYFQTCNEFGWYQTSSSHPNHIFGSAFPVDLYSSMCADIYDGVFDLEKIRTNVLATNNKHNGFVPNISNVYTTHGEFDPWRPMGITEPLNEDTPTVILTGYSHCKDLGSISDADTPQMRQTKMDITNHVRKWLKM